MGVHGLWRLIEPSGKPVPLETLENKVLAVDISIWLHQAIRGFQDSRGAPLPNAHLLGIYHRVCKLLYFRVRPVFVFDGGVPALKKETIAKRNQLKSKALNEAGRLQKQLLTTLLKHTAVNKVIADKIKAKVGPIHKSPVKSDTRDELFKLPPTEMDVEESSEDEDMIFSTAEETEEESPSTSTKWNLHTIDVNSKEFKSLPVNKRHDILTDLKETRKQSSWGRLHEMPTHSGHFAKYQMERLLKRRSVQACLDSLSEEMGGHSLSVAELESLLKDQGVLPESDKVGGRIASNEQTRYLLIKDVKKALEDAKKLEEQKLDNKEEDGSEAETTNVVKEEPDDDSQKPLATIPEEDEMDTEDKEEPNKTDISIPDLEYEANLRKAIALSLQDVPSSSTGHVDVDDPNETFSFSFLENFKDPDFESSSDEEFQDKVQMPAKNLIGPVKSYVAEYSGLTPVGIDNLIGKKIATANEKQKKETTSVNVIKKQEKLSKQSEIEKNREPIEVKIVETEQPQSKAVIEKQKIISKQPEMEKYEKAIQVKIVETEQPQSKAEEIVEQSSDSDDSDFLEVTNEFETENSTEPNKPKEETKDKSAFVVNIKPDMVLDDDLFSDIFSGSTKTDYEIKNVLMSEAETKVSSIEVKIESDKISTKADEVKLTVTDDIKENSAEIEKDKNAKNEITPPKTPPSALSVEELQEMQQNLVKESNEILMERIAKERNAANMTEQIYQEAQELLQLFGVPYIVAPMEAEAQCAFLEEIQLTDGTITDDSDVWLFGGKTVYKNFFNQDKHVLEYQDSNILHHFKLSRKQMILLALLVGSDYTTGIQGVGPVTALEILASFPPPRCKEINALSEEELLIGLRDFRKWVASGRTAGPGKAALRTKLKNIQLFEGFPNVNVVKAYLDPTVETSKEHFSWAKPNIVGLIDFAKTRFGWTQTKSQEILKPVIKRMEDSSVQKSIKDFFKTKRKLEVELDEDRLSKRVKKALDKMGKDPKTLEEEDEIEKAKKILKRKLKEEKPKEDKAKRKQKERNPKRAEACPDLNLNTNDFKEGVKPKVENTKEDKPKPKPREKKTKNKETVPDPELNDEDLKALEAAKELSKKKLEKFKLEVKERLANVASTSTQIKRIRKTEELHVKEYIPQRESDKKNMLRNKLKAIETFRKSKQGPGYLKKRLRGVRQPKEDAGLSESSSEGEN